MVFAPIWHVLSNKSTTLTNRIVLRRCHEQEFLIKCIRRAAEEQVYLCVNTTSDTINSISDAILRLKNASELTVLLVTICDYDATFPLLCYNVYIALNNYNSKNRFTPLRNYWEQILYRRVTWLPFSCGSGSARLEKDNLSAKGTMTCVPNMSGNKETVYLLSDLAVGGIPQCDYTNCPSLMTFKMLEWRQGMCDGSP